MAQCLSIKWIHLLKIFFFFFSYCDRVPWESIQNMASLHTLNLDHNLIDHIAEGAFGELYKLARLDMTSNRLRTLPPDPLFARYLWSFVFYVSLRSAKVEIFQTTMPPKRFFLKLERFVTERQGGDAGVKTFISLLSKCAECLKQYKYFHSNRMLCYHASSLFLYHIIY